MRKIILIIAIVMLGASVWAQDAQQIKDPQQLFYRADALYEKGDYAKALEYYVSILDMGLESGNLYYNIGNGFLRTGKLGYAILSYEKAKRMMPWDGDLKSNLAYARSMIEYSVPPEAHSRLIIRLLGVPFRDMTKCALFYLVLAMYLIVFLCAMYMIWRPVHGRRMKVLLYILIILFLYSMGGFLVRVYHEDIIRLGIVVVKSAQCRYEPIDKAAVYFNIKEGEKVRIVATKGEWRQINRIDGKSGWVDKESVQPI